MNPSILVDIFKKYASIPLKSYKVLIKWQSDLPISAQISM